MLVLRQVLLAVLQLARAGQLPAVQLLFDRLDLFLDRRLIPLRLGLLGAKPVDFLLGCCKRSARRDERLGLA